MRVLFVRSGNRGVDTLAFRQGESLRQLGIDIRYYNIVGKGAWGYLKNIGSLRRVVREVKPDIIHAHYGLSGLVAAFTFTPKPVVTSLMGSDVFDTTPLVLKLTGYASRHLWAATIIKSARMNEAVKLKRVTIIPNGVDMTLFVPSDREQAIEHLGWERECRHLLFPADPQRPEKNYPLAQKAIDIVGERYPSLKLKVHFLRNVEHSEAVYYYCASDLLLMTSHYEGSPNTVKEAIACNCPVVSTDVGDVKEMISATQGCYVTSADPEEISERIAEVLMSGARTDGRKNIGHLDSTITGLSIIDLYNAIIKKKNL